MKKKLLLLLFCIAPFSIYKPLLANHPYPVQNAITLPCPLPPPGNLQYSQPTPYSVQFTWNPVPGAWGYLTILTRLTGATTSQSFVGTGTSSSFAIVPGELYQVKVYPMSSPIEVCQVYSTLQFRGQILIVDLLPEMNGCTPSSPVEDGAPGSRSVYRFNWVTGMQYYIELTNSIPPATVRLAFTRKANDHFELRQMDSNPQGTSFCGFSITPSAFDPCMAPPLDARNAKITYSGLTCRFSFPVSSDLHHYVEAEETPFDDLVVYSICDGGNSHGEGGGRSKDNLFTDSDKTSSAIPVVPVNPFSDYLLLYFAEEPSVNISARLYDMQGRLRAEARIQPETLSGSAYAIETMELPAGLYILQMESADGEKVVKKVMKL